MRTHSVRQAFGAAIALAVLLAPLAVSRAGAAQAYTAASLSGTYRCWSYNVQGAGRSCVSPPIALNADGTYSMSSERGTWKVSGDRVLLSESKQRGPGRLREEGRQIVFQFTYNGRQHTMTYLRQGGASPEGTARPAAAADPRAGGSVPTGRPGGPGGAPRIVSVDLTIDFPPADGSVGWINTARLVPEGGSERDGYETLAVTDGKSRVTAYFREVQAGTDYTIYTGSGTENRPIGTVNLRDATGPVKLTLNAPDPSRDRDRLKPPRSGPGTAPRGGTSPPAKAPSAGQESAPPCNPLIPRYSQPECRETERQ